MLIYFENFGQALALAVGLITWKSIRPAFLRWIIFILALTVINEIIVVPFLVQPLHFERNVDYNLFSFADMGTWLYIFFKINQGRKLQKWLGVFGLFVLSFSVIEIIYRGWIYLHTDSFRVYEIAILLVSVSYLYRIFKMEYYILPRDPIFWVCTACIIYHSILFLNFTTLAEGQYWSFKGARQIFDILQVIGNIFYYLLLSIAFFSCTFLKPSNNLNSYRGS